MPNSLLVQVLVDLLHVTFVLLLQVPLHMLALLGLEQLSSSLVVIHVVHGVDCDEQDQLSVDQCTFDLLSIIQ